MAKVELSGKTGAGFPIETREIDRHLVWTEASLESLQKFTREHPVRRSNKKLCVPPDLTQT